MTASPSPTAVVLAPGSYLLELHAEPGVEVDANDLRAALEAAGFSDVVLDEPGTFQVPPEVAGVLASIGASFNPLRPATARPSGPSPATPPTPMQKAQGIARAMSAPPTPMQKAQDVARSMAASAQHAAARRAIAATSMKRATSPVQPLLTAAAKAAAASAAPGGKHHSVFGPGAGGPSSDGGADGGGEGAGGPDAGDAGDGSGAAPPTFTVDPSDPRYATDQDGSRYYLDPDTGVMYGVDADGSLETLDQQTLQRTGQKLPPPPPPAPGPSSDQATAAAAPSGDVSAAIEAGAAVEKPLGEDPAFSLHVGAAAPGSVYRAVARTASRVTLRPSAGLSWHARPLAVDPYAPIVTTTRPFPLRTGASYEVVLLARDRKARSRGDVWTLAEAMGFQPQAIALVVRDVHPPRTPLGAMYARWLLVGTWRGPSTITTAEEPFVFEQVARA